MAILSAEAKSRISGYTGIAETTAITVLTVINPAAGAIAATAEATLSPIVEGKVNRRSGLDTAVHTLFGLGVTSGGSIMLMQENKLAAVVLYTLAIAVEAGRRYVWWRDRSSNMRRTGAA